MGYRQQQLPGLRNRARRRYAGRSVRWWMIVAAVLVFGVFVLPHVTINGHHYRFFVF